MKKIKSEISSDLELKSVFERECRELAKMLTSTDEKRKEVEKRVCAAELKRKMLSDESRSKEARLRDCEDRLLKALGDGDGDNDDVLDSSSVSDLEQFDAVLDKLESEFKTLVDEKGFLNGVDKTYKRFLQQLQQSRSSAADHSCPVCMRFFKDDTELADTLAELKKSTNKLPQKMSDLECRLKSE